MKLEDLLEASICRKLYKERWWTDARNKEMSSGEMEGTSGRSDEAIEG